MHCQQKLPELLKSKKGPV